MKWKLLGYEDCGEAAAVSTIRGDEFKLEGKNARILKICPLTPNLFRCQGAGLSQSLERFQLRKLI